MKTGREQGENSEARREQGKREREENKEEQGNKGSEENRKTGRIVERELGGRGDKVIGEGSGQQGKEEIVLGG